MLTLPALFFLVLLVSFKELPGVEGNDLVISTEDDGDNSGRDFVDRGGVVGATEVEAVGVAGMNASSGAERVMADTASSSLGRCLGS